MRADESGDFAILFRTGDPLRARLVRQVLEHQGIPVSTPGLEHRSMLGVLGGYVEIVVRVPAISLARSREIVAALETPPSAHDEGDEGVARADDPELAGYRVSTKGNVIGGAGESRLKRIAAFVAFCWPGAGHLYARAWTAGAMLLALAVASFVAAASGITAAIVLVPVVILADIVGASWHCDRTRSPAPRWPLRRFAPELAALAVTGWIALAVGGPLDAWIAGGAGRSLCAFRAECWEIDERACLHHEAAARLDGRAPLESCASCLEAARGCRDFARCDGCPR